MYTLNERKAELEAPDKGYNYCWDTWFEGQFENGWSMVRPEQLGALTDAPIIGLNVYTTDEGEIESVEKLWWFPNYMLEIELETILTDGYVVFSRVEDDDGNPATIEPPEDEEEEDSAK